MPTELAVETKSKQSRFQYSMRTLLFFFLVAAFGLTWVAYEREETRKRHQAIGLIRGAGGWCHDNDEPISWIAKVRAFAGGDSEEPIVAVYLSKAKFGDDELVHLKSLSNLRWLEIDQTQVSDAGLIHLAGLKRLDYVDVSGTKVTESAVRKLKKDLPELTIILE